jgi:signal transduction histidine kinase
MPLKRDPSKALQIGFLALLVVSVVQVSYWIYDHVRHTYDDEERLVASYRAEADAISAVYANATPGEIQTLLPQLTVDGRAAHVRQDALLALAAERERRVNRYLWEGAFFLAVLLGGMTVLTRTIRHEIELRRRQQNFLAAVSHEFKSPLASIQLAAETLVMRARETDAQRLGRRIIEDGERLIRMIDNLLDTTRLEEGGRKLTPAPVKLLDAVTSAVAEVAERASLSGVAIEVDVPENIRVSIDPGALSTTLRNLLDNALKACAAGEGKSIAVSAQAQGSGAVLSVRDDGVGFAPEDAGMIFEKFYRSGDELQRSMPGTGLGLYIVKRLLDLSGARIAASSAGPGRGATITIEFPKATFAEAA